MDPSRRQFLVSLARVAAYAAPVVVTLSAPSRLAGGKSASEKGGGKTKSLTADFSTDLNSTSQPAPWSVSPPGSSGFPTGR